MSADMRGGADVEGWRHHPREIQRLVFVATDSEWWREDGSVAAIDGPP
jgi:hypothetical protein